jgi:hypothetical protein
VSDPARQARSDVTVQITVRLPVDLAAWVAQVANEQHTSLAAIVRGCVVKARAWSEE